MKIGMSVKTYRSYNSIVGFSNYEFYNELLDGVTLLRVTPDVTWTQPYIYIYIYIHTPINLYLIILIVEVSYVLHLVII